MESNEYLGSMKSKKDILPSWGDVNSYAFIRSYRENAGKEMVELYKRKVVIDKLDVYLNQVRRKLIQNTMNETNKKPSVWRRIINYIRSYVK